MREQRLGLAKIAMLGALTLVIAALLGWTATSSKSVLQAGAQVKQEGKRNQAPDFSLRDSDGRTVHLSDYKGKVVVLDFWATWCGPCKVEIPWFTEFERSKKDQGFAVLGVAMDEDGWSAVKPFLKDLNVNYRVVLGDDKTTELYGGIEALPTTYLIDREGRIAATHIGLTPRKEFENAIDQLLHNSEAPVALRRFDCRSLALLRGPSGAPGAGPEVDHSRAATTRR